MTAQMTEYEGDEIAVLTRGSSPAELRPLRRANRTLDKSTGWPSTTASPHIHGRRAAQSSHLDLVRPTATAIPVFSPSQMRLRRSTDIIFGFVGLVFALPLILFAGVLVAVSSRGTILFKQQRIGKGGKRFTILKFRTMRPGTHDRVRNDPALWAEYVANDYKLPGGNAEISKVGSFLRKLSLDELPQLWNVLRGDMSVVGIRPLVPAEYEGRPLRSRELYALLRPGITGRWQVEGRSSVQHADRIELDDDYVNSWGFGRDIGLLARTPLALLRSHHSS